MNVPAMCLLLAAACGPGTAEDRASFVDSIRVAAQAARASLAEVQFEDRLWISRFDSAARIEQSRESIYALERSHFERARSQADSHGVGSVFLDEIQAEHEQRMSRIDDSLIATMLNERVQLSRRVIVDRQQRRARIEQIDLRDVDALMSANGLAPESRASLDQSATILQFETHSLRRNSALPRLAIASDLQRYSEFDADCQMGILPDALFGPEYRIDVSEDGGRVVLTGIERTTGARAFEAELHPELAGRFVALRVFRGDDPARVSREYLASDFRLVNGVSAAFETEFHIFQPDGRASSAEKRAVENLELRAVSANTDGVWQFPPEVRIQDTRTALPQKRSE